MKKIYVIILIVLAFVLSIISFTVMRNAKASYFQSEQSIGTPVFKNVQIDNIKIIKIIQPDLNTIVLHKNPIISKDKSKTNLPFEWTVQNLYNYPADANKISDLIKELADLKVIQNIQIIHPSGYKELNLLPSNSDGEKSSPEIQFFGESKKPLYSLLIGKKRFTINPKNRKKIPVGRYIKTPIQKNVILTDELFSEINFKANDWLYNRDISINNIRTIQQIKDSKATWTLTKDRVKDAFKLNGSTKHTVLDKHNIKAIADSLNNLKFNSIAEPKTSSAKTGLNTPTTLMVSTFDGIKYKLLIGKTHNQNRFIKLGIINLENKTLKKKTQLQQNLFKKWIYLVNINRAEPLLLSKDNLQDQKNKRRPPTSIYSLPIS